MNARARVLAAVFLVSFAAVVTMHIRLKSMPTEEEIEKFGFGYHPPSQALNRLAPDFEAKLVDGGTWRLADNVGPKTIVINFFTTWCGPCRDEMPELDRFNTINRGDTFIMLGISVREPLGTVMNFVSELDLGFPIAYDENGIIAAKYGVYSYPTTVVIGHDGRVRYVEIGAIQNADIAFRKWITLNAVSADSALTRDSYLAILRDDTTGVNMFYGDEQLLSVDTSSHDDDITLNGRAKEIALKVECPCGCSCASLDACKNSTANRAKKMVMTMVEEGKTDTEIIRALNVISCREAKK